MFVVRKIQEYFQNTILNTVFFYLLDIMLLDVALVLLAECLHPLVEECHLLENHSHLSVNYQKFQGALFHLLRSLCLLQHQEKDNQQQNLKIIIWNKFGLSITFVETSPQGLKSSMPSWEHRFGIHHLLQQDCDLKTRKEF